MSYECLGHYFTKWFDLFSHPVPLFYSGDQKRKSSYCGATMSVVLVSITMAYTGYLMIDTWNPERQTINVIEYDLDLKEEPEIKLS